MDLLSSTCNTCTLMKGYRYGIGISGVVGKSGIMLLFLPFQQTHLYIIVSIVTRELHGNGDNGNTAVIRGNTTVVGTN